MRSPIEPARLSPALRLTEDTQPPSVRPYPSMIFNPVFASKSAISFAGIGAAPHSANSRLEMSAAGDRHVHQRREDRRHARKRRHAIMRDDLPEFCDHIFAAIAFWRGKDDVIAADPGLEPYDELGVDVKQRQAAERGARRLARLDHVRGAPGVE